MLVAGMAWITVANSLTLSAQLSLPNWVRARGMSIYQMAMMGSSALGAAVWGQVASLTSVRTSLLCAAGRCGGQRCWCCCALQGRGPAGRRPVAHRHDQAALDRGSTLDPHAGPVLVTIEYRIDPAARE